MRIGDGVDSIKEETEVFNLWINIHESMWCQKRKKKKV
jgi:hypothetical protein